MATETNDQPRVKVYIEIEKHSNMKYELNKNVNKLELDRILPYPYFYPYAYGFFLNTQGKDGDELDALVITNNNYKNDIVLDCHIVGGLNMEDESGIDEKLFVVPVQEMEWFAGLSKEKLAEMYDNNRWFFSNYKTKELNKWSKVYDFMDMKHAVSLYLHSCL
jgi:inorganic pyrophosphatase